MHSVCFEKTCRLARCRRSSVNSVLIVNIGDTKATSQVRLYVLFPTVGDRVATYLPTPEVIATIMTHHNNESLSGDGVSMENVSPTHPPACVKRSDE